MVKEKLNINNIGRYILLNNELALEDPYILKKSEEEYLLENEANIESGLISIIMLVKDSKDIGFVEVHCEEEAILIQNIYVKKNDRDKINYKELLEIRNFILNYSKYKEIKYIGLNDNVSLSEALKGNNFVMKKEHVQMEKEIIEDKNFKMHISRKSFYEIKNPEWTYNFMKECLPLVDKNYLLKDIEDISSQEDGMSFIFYKSGLPIGFIIAYINEKRNEQQNKNTIYIEEIAVYEEYRNTGYGSQILSFIINEGQKNGMNIARLHVFRDNVNAFKLYKKLGFKEIKSIGHWIFDVK